MKKSMRLILDTNEYIFGFSQSGPPESAQLLDLVGELLPDIEEFYLLLPDIIRDEVQRNLLSHLLGDFYRFIMLNPKIVQASVLEIPVSLFQHYHSDLGLKEADATIAAFAEWKAVDYLISENRHFLGLKAEKFVVCNAATFIQHFDSRKK